MSEWTHLDEEGRARMVDVTGKPATVRTAAARGLLRMSPSTLEAIRSGGLKKGDALAIARVAGIMAAKRTPEWIPLCHPIALSGFTIDLEFSDDPPAVVIEATARTNGPTGAEMEALTAVSAAALTLYDMCKSLERGMTIDEVRLISKEGGQSGAYRA